MIKQYFKQAWTMMRQNKLFTSIYVAGTGLSIAFTMVLFIIYYVKFAPIYPEYNRDRMLVGGRPLFPFQTGNDRRNDRGYGRKSGGRTGIR